MNDDFNPPKALPASSRPREHAPAPRAGGVSFTPAASLLYLLVFLLALYQLDRQNYQAAKAALIKDSFYELFAVPMSELESDEAMKALFGAGNSERASARKRLEAKFRAIVAGPSGFYEFTLLDANDIEVIRVADADKPRRLENWRHRLFLPGFSSVVDQRVKNPDARVPVRADGRRTFGRLLARYGTPPEFPSLARLTDRYRAYAGLMAVVWAGGYSFLYVRVLRPMRRVTARLAEAHAGAPPRLIEGPGVLLESNFNRMASLALLQKLEEGLTALLRPADAGGASPGQVVPAMLTALRDWFGLTDGVAGEVTVGAAADCRPEWAFGPGGPAGPELADRLARRAWADLAAFEGRAPGGRAAAREIGSTADDSGPSASDHARFGLAEDDSILYLAALGGGAFLAVTGRLLPRAFGSADPPADGRTHGHAASVPLQAEMVRRACDGLRRGLTALRASQREVLRQKSEANIVLSRNLGHDLTNIIATTKLDLMAVRRLIDAPANGRPAPPTEMLRPSVQGLMDSTRFLQEVVNLYRSFSHVKRPQYERRDLNGLVEEFLRAFEPSVSSRVEIVRAFAEGMPAPILEPRLLKLALFNVITNALDAHKRAAGLAETDAPAGNARVTVGTSYDAETGLYRIDIDDNGPGLRGADGHPLLGAEAAVIFRHGYSTKETEVSEGLGLAWVKSIVEEFHDGAATADNLPGGGARVSLALRSMEKAEARVKDPTSPNAPPAP